MNLKSQEGTLAKRRTTARVSKWGLLAMVLILLILVPSQLSTYFTLLLFSIFLYVAMSEAFNLTAGYTGLPCIGQVAFLGIGAYTAALLMSNFHMVWPLAVLLGGVVATFFALVISPAVFRMSGFYFIIGTLALAQGLQQWMINWDVSHYGASFSVPHQLIPSPTMLYYIAFGVAVVTVAVLAFLIRSRLGKSWQALRDNERSAQSVGVNIFRTKLSAFMISAFITGIAGALWAIRLQSIEPYSMFNISWSFGLLMMVMIGGGGTIVGPIIGTLFYTAFGEIFAGIASLQVIIVAAVLVVVIRFLPDGLWGSLLKSERVKRIVERFGLKGAAS